MKLRFEKISIQENRSIQVLDVRKTEFDAPWHYHPEWELTFIRQGQGKRFVGNSIEPFQPGDLVLLGPDLPHFWHSEPQLQSNGSASSSEAIVVQFPDAFLGASFLQLPEMEAIRQLFQKGKQGLFFSGKQARTAAQLLAQLPNKDPFSRILGLLEVLQILSKASARSLSQTLYRSPAELESSTRLGKAYAYLIAHFQGTPTLDDIARAAAMSPAAFSRFFKRMTNRNVWDLLNDLRVEHACRLLRDTTNDITSIAFESGFGTLSSFNRHFRRTHKRTPSDYRKMSTLLSQQPLESKA